MFYMTPRCSTLMLPLSSEPCDNDDATLSLSDISKKRHHHHMTWLQRLTDTLRGWLCIAQVLKESSVPGKVAGAPGNAFELVYQGNTNVVRQKMHTVDPVLGEWIRYSAARLPRPGCSSAVF